MKKQCFFRIWIVVIAMALPCFAKAVQDAKTVPAGASQRQSSQGQSSQGQSSPPEQAQPEQISSDKKPSDKKTGDSSEAKASTSSEKQKPENSNWYSMENEIKLGKEFAQQVDAKAVFITDPVIVEYISRIGQNLVRQSEAKFSFSFRVIDSPEPRAFALPGGIAYVNSGLLRTAENESELAAVMAHAIAHVNARHVTRLLTRGESSDLQQKSVDRKKSTLPDYCSMYAMCEKDESAGTPHAFFKLSPNFEKDADWLGVQYVYKAGYHPNGFLTFLEKHAQEEKKTSSPAMKFQSHPTAEERITMISKEIVSILPPRPSYIIDTPEFQMIKARLVSVKTQ